MGRKIDIETGGSVRPVSLFGMVLVAAVMTTGCGGGGDSAQDEPEASQRQQALAADVSASATATWTEVAAEGEYFRVLNTVPIRFGAGDKWVKLRLSGSFQCNATTFGSDPAPGVAKTCQSRDSFVAANGMVTWTKNSDPAVVGYRVYYGSAPSSYFQPSGSGFAAGNNSRFTVVNLPSGQTSYFAVTSVDSTGRESPYSAEVSKKVP